MCQRTRLKAATCCQPAGSFALHALGNNDFHSKTIGLDLIHSFLLVPLCCEGFIARNMVGQTNSGHFGPAAPFVVYGLLYLWRTVDTSSAWSRRFAKYEKLLESALLTLAGLFTALGDGLHGLRMCWHPHHQFSKCVDENLMHVLAALLTMQGGILIFFTSRKLFRQVFNFAWPVVMGSMGVMFLSHEQDKLWFVVVHYFLGWTMVLAGIFKSLADIWPSLRILTSFFLLAGALLFCLGSPAAYFAFGKHNVNGHNTVLLAFNVSFAVVLSFMAARWRCGEAAPSSPDDASFFALPASRLQDSGYCELQPQAHSQPLHEERHLVSET